MPNLAPIRLALAGLAGAATLLAAPGAALGADRIADHVSAPTGLVETPDGARWIADAVLGVCRLDDDGHGVVPSPYCAEEHAGPVKATGLAYSAKGDFLFSGDSHSAGGAIWRLRWNRATGTIDGGASLARLPDDRVTAMALAGDDVVFATKRSAAVQRVPRATGQPGPLETIGFAQREDAPGIAALGAHAYLAERTGLTRLALDGSEGIASQVPGAVGTAPTAVAADADRNRLYLGTTHVGLADEVLALDLARGALETYASGFTGVTGIGIEPDGDLLVGDDPMLASGAIDSADQGRVWRVPLAPLGRPVVSITDAPAATTSAATVTFAYAGPAGTRFECRLDGAEWTPCEGDGRGTTSFAALGEGVHAFEVRGVGEAGRGLGARRVFTIDRTAPAVRVSGPSGEVVGPRARLEFAGDEALLAYACSLDDAAFAPCEPGELLTDLALGEHTIRVIAADPAGNVSDPHAADARRAFTVLRLPTPEGIPWPVPAPRPTPAPVPQPSAAGGPAPAPPVADAGDAPAPVPAAAPVAAAPVDAVAAPVRPHLDPFRLRPGRIVASRSPRSLALGLSAPANARVAHVAIRGGAGRTRVARDLPVRPGARNRLVLRLTAKESRRLRPGLYLVTASLGAEPGVVGNMQAHWLRVLPRG